VVEVRRSSNPENRGYLAPRETGVYRHRFTNGRHPIRRSRSRAGNAPENRDRGRRLIASGRGRADVRRTGQGIGLGNTPQRRSDGRAKGAQASISRRLAWRYASMASCGSPRARNAAATSAAASA